MPLIDPAILTFLVLGAVSYREERHKRAVEASIAWIGEYNRADQTEVACGFHQAGSYPSS